MATIEFRGNAERAQTLLTIDELIVAIELDSGKPFNPLELRTVAEMLSKFVWEGEDYLPYPEARARVGKLTVEQLLATAKNVFGGLVEDAAVPPANGAGSAPRSSSTRRSPRAGSSRSTRRANGARRPGK